MSEESTAQLSRALSAVREMRSRMEAAEAARHEPIAIVGMGCRFPAAGSPTELWELVRSGGDAVTETPPDRWPADDLFDESPEAPGRVATRWGGFVDGVDLFDAGFFGISPREAEQMDPQQRLMLEVTWEALEDAGQTAEGISGTATGVFVGVHSHSSDYFAMQAADPLGLDLYSGTGTSHSVVSGRISYLFDLRGPSVALDTACSSSLVAVHLGIQSLRSGESDMVIAGGVNTMHDPTFTMVASRMRMMSPTGRCRPFDAGADGFVRSEGCGVVVLKRLSDAQRDGDRVHAVIAGSAINQDGRSNGLTAPNSLSQQDVLTRALEDARVDAASIGLLEAHGTGTPLGDPIEVEALAAVFGARARDAPLHLGSVKANIGHAEGAAGIAGVIKAVLAIRAGEIPPLTHFDSLNPHLDLDAGTFAIPTETVGWPGAAGRRHAGVSSFGWSGTNAHVVIASAPDVTDPEDVPESTHPLLLPISARSEGARSELAEEYRRLLDGLSASDARKVCASAARRRSHHPYRLAVAGRSAGDLADSLDAHLAGEERREVWAGVARSDATVFVYPGQGSQWDGMARRSSADDDAFADALRRCDEAMRPHLDWSIVDRIEAAGSVDDSERDAIDVVQPMLFATQVAATAALAARGIRPDAVVGHSMGEVAAAHTAGALSLDDAAHVICRRSALLRRIAGTGAMGVVGLGPDAAAEVIAGLEDRLAVAVSNGPSSSVLSGDPAALEQVFAALDERGIFCRLVKVDVASHSPQVDELLPELVADLAALRPAEPRVSFMSTVTADFETVLDAEYWGRNLRSAVMFSSAMQRLIATGHGRTIEISPHPLLLNDVRAALDEAGRVGATVPVNWRDSDEPVALAAAVGALYVDGSSPDWAAIHPHLRVETNLPGYPWQHERFWLPDRGPSIGSGRRDDDLLGSKVDVAADGLTIWERTVDRRADPSWFEHRISGRPSLPASALGLLMLRAGSMCGVDGSLTDIRLERLMLLDDDAPTRLQTTIDDRGRARCVTVSTWRDGAWVEHARATVPEAPDAADDARATGDAGESPAASTRSRGPDVDADAYYGRLAAASYELGPSLRTVGDIRLDGTTAFVTVRGGPDVDRDLAVVDAALQASLAAASSFVDGAPERMPVAIDTLTRHAMPADEMSCRVDLRAGDPTGSDEIVVDSVLTDADGVPVTTAAGIRLRRLDRAVERPEDWVYTLAWRPADEADDGADQGGPALPVSATFLLVGGDEVAEALTDELAARGAATRLVDTRELDRIVVDNTVDRHELGRIAGDDTVGGIVVLAPASAAEEPTDAEGLVSVQAAGAAAMVRAIAVAAAADAAVPVVGVTRDVHRITERDRGAGFAHAPVWGLGRALLEEQPELAGGLIDLDSTMTAVEAARAIAEELSRAEHHEVAWRNGARWVPRLERLELPHGQPPSLRSDETVLVTGGFGSIGAQVARRLVERGAAHVALLGRTALPPRREWAELPATGPIGRRVALVRDLEAMGATVHLLVADTGDEPGTRSVLAGFAADGWPPIRTVHHTAATFGGQLLGELTEGELVDQLVPKLVGAWVLADELAELDQLVLYSSIAALMPLAGQAAYAAGNAFLDAFAQRRRADGRTALSVQWGFWEGSSDDLEGETGQRRDAGTVGYKEAARALAEARGMRAFPAARGLDVLERLSGADVAQATVVPFDWPAWVAARGERPLGPAADVARTESGSRPDEEGSGADLLLRLRDASDDERIDLVEDELRRVVARVLKLSEDRLDVTQPFGNLGMDSLMAIEIRNRLEPITGLTLSATLAWNYPSVRELGGYLVERLSDGESAGGDAADGGARDDRSGDAPIDGGADIDRLAGDVSGLSDAAALASLLGEEGS